MNIKTKVALLTMAVLTFGGTKAYASVDSYLLKDSSNNVYEYNLQEVKDSLVDTYLSNESKLYTQFKNDKSESEFYLVYDSEGKYVSFKDLKESLVQKTLKNEEFVLDEEVKTIKESKKPDFVEKVKVQNKELLRELHILKDECSFDGAKILKNKYEKIVIKANNVELKNIDIDGEIVVDPGKSGKAILSNVKCKNINILSGDKKGIHFENVKSDKVEKNKDVDIEIQYEKDNDEIKESPSSGSTSKDETKKEDKKDKVSEEEKQKMLKQLNSELNSLLPKVTNKNENIVLTKINEGIKKAIDDTTYDYSKDMKEALKLKDNLSQKEKEDLKDKLLRYVDVFNTRDLLKIYNIDISSL